MRKAAKNESRDKQIELYKESISKYEKSLDRNPNDSKAIYGQLILSPRPQLE